jgi:hypothetical protein
MIAQLNKHYLRLSLFKTWQRLVAYFLFEGRPLTTKGQWFNPMVRAWLKCAIAVSKPALKYPPVFIIGTGRSGTTLLGLLLSMHKNIAFLNEPKMLWHLANRADDVIGSYNNTGGTFLLNAYDSTPLVIAKIRKAYSAFLKMTSGKIVLDKYPEIVFRTGYVEKIFPGCRFLFITRNFSDTVLSNVQWNKTNAIHNCSKREDWWGLNNKKWKLICEELLPNSKLLRAYIEEIRNFEDDTLKSAVEWIVTMEQGLALLKSRNNIWHLKYENLVEEAEPALTKTLNFLNLDMDEKVSIYAKAVLKKNVSKKVELTMPDFLIQAASEISVQLNYKPLK